MIGKTNAVGGGEPKILHCNSCYLPNVTWTQVTGSYPKVLGYVPNKLGTEVVEHNGVMICYPTVLQWYSPYSGAGSSLKAYSLTSETFEQILLSSFGITSLSELPDGSYSANVMLGDMKTTNTDYVRITFWYRTQTITFSISNGSLSLDNTYLLSYYSLTTSTPIQLYNITIS